MKNFNSLRSRPRDRRQMYSKEMNVVKLIVCCFGEGRAGCGKVLALRERRWKRDCFPDAQLAMREFQVKQGRSNRKRDEQKDNFNGGMSGVLKLRACQRADRQHEVTSAPKI